MKNPWKRTNEYLPKKYAPLLLYTRHKDFTQFGYTIVYGYMKFAAGDRSCPSFITPGATQTELGEPELWMYCKEANTKYEPQILWKFARERLEIPGEG